MVTSTIAGLLLLGVVAWKAYQARQAVKKVGDVVVKGPIYPLEFWIFAAVMILLFWMFGKLSLWFAAFSGFGFYLEWLKRFYLGTEGLKAGTKFYERSRLITYEVAEGNGPVIDIIVAGAMDPVRLSCKERDFAGLKEQIVRYFEENPDGPRTADTGKAKISAV
ncbi:hypothetical protein [Paenibacillus sp. UNC499MF]|uniref:hypothetical protein n=1 Tax=Paenibacillus sp. UNC499MF TaxID=1502751 RepID=UPI00089FF2D0|nr:hypothetical protein [Paenibacillus sp. UNC499MF]SEG03816.1 hypothetical protein SAMN02799616_01634 [Paenibacillus sp. UNC499MF]